MGASPLRAAMSGALMRLCENWSATSKSPAKDLGFASLWQKYRCFCSAKKWAGCAAFRHSSSPGDERLADQERVQPDEEDRVKGEAPDNGDQVIPPRRRRAERRRRHAGPMLERDAV